MIRSNVFALLLVGSLVGCGDKDDPAPKTTGGPAKDAPASHDGDAHGAEVSLGSLELLDQTFEVVLHGEVVAGQEAAFSVRSPGRSLEQLLSLSLYLWLESEDKTQLSAPAKGMKEGSDLHFHTEPKAGSKPENVVLRLRADGKDVQGRLPLDGHGHTHDESPHHGVMAALQGGVGHLELKLHDDKGDLELWLTRDVEGHTPLDLPLDTVVHVTFIDKGDRKVELRVRNRTKNEDEDGNVQVRSGKTNYFIYPGDTGADASWLQGPDFTSLATVEFTADGTTIRSEEFSLAPHVH